MGIILSNYASYTVKKYSIQRFDYGSTTSDFVFDCYPAKGRGVEVMDMAKASFDERNNTSTQICRRFAKNYLKFWQWYEYLNNPYYKYPQCGS
jgi:hypothetical protein